MGYITNNSIIKSNRIIFKLYISYTMSYQIPNEDKLEKHTDDEHYIRSVEYANLKILIAPKLIMVLLWTLLIILFYYPYRNYVGNKYIYAFILSIPYLVILYELFLNRKKLFSSEAHLPIRS